MAASESSDPSAAPATFVVVGGGMAGLTAAETLADEGRRRVVLVEPTGRCGGVLDTVRHDGWLIERSADNFLAARPEGLALVDRLGLTSSLVGVDPAVRRALVFHRGRTVPVPPGFRLLAPGRPAAVLTSPLLSPLGKLRVLAERFVPPRPDGTTDESLEHFAVRRLGREAFERLVQPLVAGIWTADSARLSMAAACPEFLAMEHDAGSLTAGERARLRKAGRAAEGAGARYGQFVTLVDGMGTLPTKLVERLAGLGVEFRSAAARRVVRDGGGWIVECDGGIRVRAAGVVVATRAPVAAGLVAEVDRPLSAALGAIEYAGSAVVSLGYERSAIAHPLDAAGVVVPRNAGRKILAISFSSVKYPGRAPAGHALVRVFVGGALDPDTALLPDGPLVDLVQREIATVIGARGTPRLVQIDRWAGAMPQYHVGHVDRVALIRERLAALPGLAVAGAAYEGVGIPQVIASGQAAARAVAGKKG
ncbi:MAG: protoporphyrinogen oxidase [Planctomycetia bacterium]